MTSLGEPTLLCFDFLGNLREMPWDQRQGSVGFTVWFSGFGNIQTFAVRRDKSLGDCQQVAPPLWAPGPPSHLQPWGQRAFSLDDWEQKNSFRVTRTQILAPAE